MEQSSRLACSSSGELCDSSSALGLGSLLYIPGLLSGDLYQKLIPSWDHSKAYMSALATSIKVRISAARRLQEKGGGTCGGEARVAGEGRNQEDLEGVEVLGRVRALGYGLLELLKWSAGEAGSMSSNSGNVGITVTSSTGGFGAPEQLFAPQGIQLVVLLWAARGLGMVGPLLLPFVNMREEDAELAAIFEGLVIDPSSKGNRSSSSNIKGIRKSGRAVEDDVNSSSSRSSSIYDQGASENSSSSGETGGSSSCTGHESNREWVLSDVLEEYKSLNLLKVTSLRLIHAMYSWPSAASYSPAGAEPSVRAGHCLSSAAAAADPSNSSAQDARAVANNTAAAAARAAPSSSGTSSAGEAMPAAMTAAAAAAQPIARDHGLRSTSTAHNSSSRSPHAAAAAAPSSDGPVPKRLAKLPRSSLPAAVVDQLSLVMGKWDLRYHRDGKLYLDPSKELPREQELEFVEDVVRLAEVLLAEVHTPLGCSNPRCVNLAGPSELQLARKSCNACKVVYYCSRECQTAHWGTHKHQCKKLKQEQGDKRQGGVQAEQGTQ